MKFSLLLAAALAAALPVCARAEANPSYERDAKPILETQPGLIQYIHAHFVVKDAGIARVPGTPDRPPQPPYIFSARPRGSSGPFYLRLLIQPGPAGHVLKVADIRRLPPGTPELAPAAPPEETASAPAPSSAPHVIGSSAPPSTPEPAPASSSPQPSADTPSGPVRD